MVRVVPWSLWSSPSCFDESTLVGLVVASLVHFDEDDHLELRPVEGERDQSRGKNKR